MLPTAISWRSSNQVTSLAEWCLRCSIRGCAIACTERLCCLGGVATTDSEWVTKIGSPEVATDTDLKFKLPKLFDPAAPCDSTLFSSDFAPNQSTCLAKDCVQEAQSYVAEQT